MVEEGGEPEFHHEASTGIPNAAHSTNRDTPGAAWLICVRYYGCRYALSRLFGAGAALCRVEWQPSWQAVGALRCAYVPQSFLMSC